MAKRSKRTSDRCMEILKSHLEPAGFECHPFKVEWYNGYLENGSCFYLDYEYDTLAVVIMSTPSMFDKSFKPYIRQDQFSNDDPVDACVQQVFEKAKQLVLQKMRNVRMIETIYEHEKVDGRARVLMENAGHAAGAARFYQRIDLTHDPWERKQNIHGVSVHPKYGGWFAFRGVFIFEDVLAPDLQERAPPDGLPDNSDRVKLLRGYNSENPEDRWVARDIMKVADGLKYSKEQQAYFKANTEGRKLLVENMRKTKK